VNAHTLIKAAAIFVMAMCVSDEAVAQAAPVRREIVRAGPATLQVTVSGQGEPV